MKASTVSDEELSLLEEALEGGVVSGAAEEGLVRGRFLNVLEKTLGKRDVATLMGDDGPEEEEHGAADVGLAEEQLLGRVEGVIGIGEVAQAVVGDSECEVEVPDVRPA